MQKIIIICGPTATGKSDLGITLAHTIHTDIISADSRQAYKGMDIGTGKDLPQDSQYTHFSTLRSDNQNYSIGYYVKDNIKHWLFNLTNPDQMMNSGLYRNACLEVIKKLKSEKKIPIVVGGTGFYIRSLLDPPETITVPPNFFLRNQLEHESLESLQQELILLNKTKWSSMNQSDQSNPRRLIRAIEVAKSMLVPPQNIKLFDPFLIGLTAPLELLYERIEKRVAKRVSDGFINEVTMLIKKYPNFLGIPSGKTLGYCHIGKCLLGSISLDQAIIEWTQAEKKYAKRQLTWFKKQPNIHWFDITSKNWYAQVKKELEKWRIHDPNGA